MPAAAKSSAVHFTVRMGKLVLPTLPSLRALGPSGRRLFERIEGEGKRLEIDLDGLDSLRRGQLVDRGDRQDRRADEKRLIGQDRRLRRHELRYVMRRQHANNAFHRERVRYVDLSHPRMRHRAREELAIEHAFGAHVLGIGCLAADFGRQIRGHEVLADQLVSHVRPPPTRA